MEYEVKFKCISDNLEEIPEEVTKIAGTTLPEAHMKGELMAALSKALKEYHKDNISMVPFCMTVEAEALGADIKMGNEKIGPRVGKYAFESIEELKDLKEIDLTKKRISEVLKSVEILNKQGETVALSVQGPFTIMSTLIDPRIFYRAIRKDKASVETFMTVIQDGIVKYIEEGVKRGAKIISFGDSTGTLDIVGPKVYKEFSGRYTYNVLKRVEDKLGNAILHLCGITSVALDKAEFIKSIPIEVEENITYGQAINKIIQERKDVNIIGHYCLKKTPIKMKKPVIWKIEL
jgi:uroporphyrinogen-III decarboxylase